MICSIMMAYLKQIGETKRFRDVWIGIGAAIVVAVVGGMIVFHRLRTYDGSTLQTEIEGISYLVACGVLTYMTFWMKRQGRGMRAELQHRMATALSAGSVLAIATIAFITVGREGLETVVFMIAIAFNTSAKWLSLGAGLGVMAGLTLSYMIYVLGRKVNLTRFFDWMGTLLMLFAAGLLADGIQAFQSLHWLPAQSALWTTSRVLSEDTTVGDILHSLFGYADSPTGMQVTVYIVYIALVIGVFWNKRGMQWVTQLARR